MRTNTYLKTFIQLQEEFEKLKGEYAPIDLYVKLVAWANNLANSNEKTIKELYVIYFDYFKNLEIKDFSFQPLWYNFSELMQFDFLNHNPKDLKRTVVVVRDILWEIIAFKTNRNCKVIETDNLRLLTNSSRDVLYFCCDTCSYAENIDGTQIKITEILYPATTVQILNSKVSPANL